MIKLPKSLVVFSILFLQLCWIPNSTLNTASKMNDSVGPILGQKTAIIILADFLDTNFTVTQDLIEQRASNMTSYFSEVSYTKMLLEVDIVNRTYTLLHNMSFYANLIEQFARNCISQADTEINYNLYNYVLVLHAGQSKQRMEWTDNSKYIPTCAIMELSIQTSDEKVIDSCVILSEYDSLRSFCHEVAHLLGLPDLRSWAHKTQGDVGCWDLMGMSTISQEFDGPVQLSAWSRIRLGWIDSSSIKIVNISDTQDTTMLSDLETSPQWGIKTKAIKVAVTTDIYYLVELRNQILSDRNLPSSGILIYRCDESASDERSHSIIVMDTSVADFQRSEERKTYSDAAFDDERPVFCDPVNGIAIEVFAFYPSASLVTVYRQQKLHTLKLALPQSGIMVTVDDREYVSDENGEVVAIVLRGNHTVKVDLPPGSSSYTITRWSDGVTSNPREIQVLTDTTLACFFLAGEREEDRVNYLLIILFLTISVALLTISVILLRIRYKRALSDKLVYGSS